MVNPHERPLLLIDKLLERFKNVDWEIWADLQELRDYVLNNEQNELAQGFIDAINKKRD